jgi:hypothetical protein
MYEQLKKIKLVPALKWSIRFQLSSVSVSVSGSGSGMTGRHVCRVVTYLIHSH